MKTLFAFFVLLFVIPANAAVIDEIAALEKHKTVAVENKLAQQRTVAKAKPQTFRLSTGQVLNITHWQIVHFMKSDCQYCQHFNSLLNATAQQLGIPVTPTDFIVNTQTMVAIPVSQGMLSAEMFVNRLAKSFGLAEKLGFLQ
ncbi:Uncharacterized protein FWK35_00012093 [Aphis craccivora]|uniref:Uncharacterized protein n=1 Tax=Aphis craccivora TaxID=307492 RepID=A0A6G0Y7M8_APHCR|nr:Uncharacterized protein FWK35_00012093 [Aphis craccivora]